jgi:hypothetical protein
MKRLTGKVILEMFGGGVAMIGAAIAALCSTSDRSWIGVYVGVGCILVGWAAFTFSQIEEEK